jgi:hypothetical protein
MAGASPSETKDSPGDLSMKSDYRRMAQDAKETLVFEELFYCDECGRCIGLKLPGHRPFACVFCGWFRDPTNDGDYCRTCTVKFLESENVKPQDVPPPDFLRPKTLIIHDVDDPRATCVFCHGMDDIQWCSKCYETPVARGPVGHPDYDELVEFYFDDRKDRVIPAKEDGARAALIAECLERGDADGVAALLVDDPDATPPLDHPSATGTDLPICKDCWYLYRN